MILTGRSGFRHRRRILSFDFHARFERRGRAARRLLEARLRGLLVFRAELRLAIGLLNFTLAGRRSIQRAHQFIIAKMELQGIDNLLHRGQVLRPCLWAGGSGKNRLRLADMLPNDAKTITVLHEHQTCDRGGRSLPTRKSQREWRGGKEVTNSVPAGTSTRRERRCQPRNAPPFTCTTWPVM
jgi:hypothetical protein